jgi:hypothetical protein
MDWLIDWLFTVLRPAQEYFTYGDVATADEGLQNLGQLSGAQGLWAGRDLYRATPAVTRDLIFLVSSEGPPLSVISYDTQGEMEDLFYPGS